MTFEKLLGMSAKDWADISDADLYKILEPYFTVTRPEKVPKQTNGPGKEKTQMVKKASHASLHAELLKQATLAGIVLPTDK